MRFSIKAKLAAGFGTIILMSLGAGLFAIRDLGEMNGAINQLIDGPTEKVKLGLHLETLFSNLAKAEKNMILADNDQMMDKYDAEILKARQDMKTLQEHLRALATEAGKQDLDRFHASVEQYIVLQDKIRELARRNTEAKGSELSQKEAQQRVDAVLESLRTLREQMAGMPSWTEQARGLLALGRVADAVHAMQRLEKDIVINTTDAGVERYREQLRATLAQLPQLRQEVEELLPAQLRAAWREATTRLDTWSKTSEQAVAIGAEHSNAKHSGCPPGKVGN